MDQQIAALPGQRKALQAAKETLEPRAIQRAAADLERTRMFLLLAHAALQRGVEVSEEERADFVAAQHRATEEIAVLQEEVERARAQASRLVASSHGALAQLPQTAPSVSPEETRDRARAIAPLGLCDDRTMQRPDSHACPLTSEQRDALRERVVSELQSIANSWEGAATMAHVKARLRPLLQKSGLHPLLALVINIATGWIAGRLAGMVKGPPSMNASPALSRTISVVSFAPDVPGGPDIAKPLSAVMKGLGMKLAETALEGERVSRANVDVLFQGIGDAADRWRVTATTEVRQLPDPALVALGEGLMQQKFDTAFFASKMERLIAGFDVIEKIGVVEIGEWQPLEPVWVVRRDGRKKLALARAATVLVDNHVPARSSEPGPEAYEARNAKYHFHSWVDRSLNGLALAKQPTSTLLVYNDFRWEVNPSDPEKHEDVDMLAREPRKDA